MEREMEREAGMGCEMVLIGGSYEQIVFGYRIKRPGQSWDPEPDFTHHAHGASLTTVAVNDQYVATGSKDETIQLYNMKKKIDQGSLLYHAGTITCLEFYGTTHLLSGAEDGIICVWDTKKWECLKSIPAHKGHVSSLSVHPSGKLALSVGTDKTLRTWNLIDGKPAFIKNIKQNAQIVQWSPSGNNYIVVSNNQLDIYALKTASINGTIMCKKRISSVKFITVPSCPLLLSEVNTSARLTCLAVWLSNPASIAQEVEEQEGAAINKHCKEKENKIKVAPLDGDEHPKKRGKQILCKRKMAAETKERRKKFF
ncbi:p21-activated protein kinase-interacting protein 1-like isoform X4 [Cetorhinus maximus]